MFSDSKDSPFSWKESGGLTPRGLVPHRMRRPDDGSTRRSLSSLSRPTTSPYSKTSKGDGKGDGGTSSGVPGVDDAFR